MTPEPENIAEFPENAGFRRGTAAATPIRTRQQGRYLYPPTKGSPTMKTIQRNVVLGALLLAAFSGNAMAKGKAKASAAPKPTSPSSATAGASAAPAGATEKKEAPSMPVEQLYLNAKAPALVSSLYDLERTEDLKTFFAKVDPKYMVHTVNPVTTGGYMCPSSWDIQECEKLDGSNPAGAALLKSKTWFSFDKYGWAMGWDPDNTDLVDTSFYGTISKKFPALAKNTSGFIVQGPPSPSGNVTYPAGAKEVSIRFLALDGTMYLVQASHLASGGAPLAESPKSVQHTMYIDSDSDFGKGEGPTPENRPWEPQQKTADNLHAKRDALNACNTKAWSPAQRLFEANEEANITSHAREARQAGILKRFTAVAAGSCRAAFVNYAKAIQSVNDDKRKNRSALYEANKARFLK